MIAEIYGKEAGCAKGKGGSMHLIDEAVGFMGSTAIVGGTIPVGVGLALGMSIQKTDQVACVFLGDAAIETGVFYEAANFAALRKLPVLFVCENNLYSVYTPFSRRQPEDRKIFEMVRGIGLTTSHHDGNHAETVLGTATAALEAIRQGSGPQLIEYDTYRWREHCGPNYDNDIGYRTEAEFQAWKIKDPIAAFESRLLEAKSIDRDWLDAADARIYREVHAAFDFAKAAPFPAQSQAFTHLLAG
jgi:pyruvate dehydrogenase E1 component alpha subunit